MKSSTKKFRNIKRGGTYRKHLKKTGGADPSESLKHSTAAKVIQSQHRKRTTRKALLESAAKFIQSQQRKKTATRKATKSQQQKKTASDKNICPICLDEMDVGDAERPLLQLQCKHSLHKDCVEELKTRGHRKCPLCRETVPELKDKDWLMNTIKNALENNTALDAIMNIPGFDFPNKTQLTLSIFNFSVSDENLHHLNDELRMRYVKNFINRVLDSIGYTMDNLIRYI